MMKTANKTFWLTIRYVEDGTVKAYTQPVNESDNVQALLRKVKGLMGINLFHDKAQAEEKAELFNAERQTYRAYC